MSGWIYGIVVVMVFGTVILQMTPEGTYQKYVRLFVGALLMLTVIGPLYSWLDLSEGSRLFFKQEVLFAWMGVTSWEDGSSKSEWQESDLWEATMKEQVSRKQESWVRQVLESTAEEYGFSYLDHKVQWDMEGSWPERLTLWVKRQDAGEGDESEVVLGVETDYPMSVEKIAEVIPIVSVTDRDADRNSNSGETYYEPSELRPLHQALQVVWQLEEGQIVVYWQR